MASLTTNTSSAATLWRTSLIPFVTHTRSIHSAPICRSHIGSLPLPIPSTVTLNLPELSLPLTSTSTSSSFPPRSINITGPLGTTSLPIPAPIIFSPTSSSGLANSPPSLLALTIHDPSIKQQRALWGLTRALLSNAITGVSEGYRLIIRLVGVGYRASVEPIPPALQQIISLRPRPPSTAHLEPSTQRLNLKLGYAHPIFVDIPSDVTVSTPQPTRIVLSGTDKQRLGLFAAIIRRWREPEPYRGKGVFVGDETIKLKEVKKK